MLARAAGKDFNIQFLVGLAFSVAASANFPPLILSLVWRRFTTAGAVTGVVVGLLTSVTLIILSPSVWPGQDSAGSPFPLSNPAIVSVPVAFIACWLGTLIFGGDGEDPEAFDELLVRSEIGADRDEAQAAVGSAG